MAAVVLQIIGRGKMRRVVKQCTGCKALIKFVNGKLPPTCPLCGEGL